MLHLLKLLSGQFTVQTVLFAKNYSAFVIAHISGPMVLDLLQLAGVSMLK
jgi:hypothetical protein